MMVVALTPIPLLETALEVALNRLSVLLGAPPGAVDHQLVTVAEIPTPDEDIATGLPVDLLRRRPDIPGRRTEQHRQPVESGFEGCLEQRDRGLGGGEIGFCLSHVSGRGEARLEFAWANVDYASTCAAGTAYCPSDCRQTPDGIVVSDSRATPSSL